MASVFTTEQLTQMKKKAEEKLNKKATLQGKLEAIIQETKKRFNVSSSKELKELSESITIEASQANTEYEEACEKFREDYDI